MNGRYTFQRQFRLVSAGFLATSLLLALAMTASTFFFSDLVAIAANAAPLAPSVPVTLIVGNKTTVVHTSANDVGALLEEQGITLGKSDIVYPSLADRIVPHERIRVTRVMRWVRSERLPIAQRTIRHFVFSLRNGKTKILAHGNAGVRQALVRYEQRNHGRVTHKVLTQTVVRKPRPRIVAVGVHEYAAFVRLERRGLAKTAYVASRTLRMVATAYTASCAGCSGITSIGRRAGHGIVAVDPHFIPLGTHLYIPGYGLAIAGDTGSAIRGNRIDLGFDSISDAMQFGRRNIVVYQLK